MQGQAWVSLFQRIPPSYHDNLVVITSTGTEIILQTVICLESDYVVVRGRTSGSTDAGRVLILPFAHIDYLGFHKRITEPEVQTIFGASLSAVAQPVAVVATPAAAPAAPATPLPVPPIALAEAVSPAESEAAKALAKRVPQASKSLLLARLRARLAKDGKQSEP